MNDSLPEPIENIDDLFDLFGGAGPLSRATGIDAGNLRVMKHRGAIHSDHWPAIVDAVAAKGRVLSMDDMSRLAKARRPAEVRA